jgi:hypothetical protein
VVQPPQPVQPSTQLIVRIVGPSGLRLQEIDPSRPWSQIGTENVTEIQVNGGVLDEHTITVRGRTDFNTLPTVVEHMDRVLLKTGAGQAVSSAVGPLQGLVQPLVQPGSVRPRDFAMQAICGAAMIDALHPPRSPPRAQTEGDYLKFKEEWDRERGRWGATLEVEGTTRARWELLAALKQRLGYSVWMRNACREQPPGFIVRSSIYEALGKGGRVTAEGVFPECDMFDLYAGVFAFNPSSSTYGWAGLNLNTGATDVGPIVAAGLLWDGTLERWKLDTDQDHMSDFADAELAFVRREFPGDDAGWLARAAGWCAQIETAEGTLDLGPLRVTVDFRGRDDRRELFLSYVGGPAH